MIHQIHMLYGSRRPVFIQKNAGVADYALHASVLRLLREFRSHILQTDRSHAAFRQTVQYVFSVFVLTPDPQL